jgi:hypothetical protein
MEFILIKGNNIMPRDYRRLPRPKQKKKSQSKSEKSDKITKKATSTSRAPPVDGMLFPGTRIPSKMNKKTAKKLKKAKYKF